MTGHLRVRGDLPQLVDRSDVFDGIDDVFAPLRAETSY